MTYTFQNIAYPTVDAMHDAIALADITAGGRWGCAQVTAFFADASDIDLADDCIRGWDLDGAATGYGLAHFRRDLLVEAYARLRATPSHGTDV